MTDVNDWNTQIIQEFRENNGNVGGNFEGAPMVLLNTTGAKTGKSRTNPLVALVVDDRVFIFASKAGAPTNPDWYHNIIANPRVTIEQGTEHYEAEASVVQGAERDRLFEIQKERMPGFADYEAGTDREIPVIELQRVA